MVVVRMSSVVMKRHPPGDVNRTVVNRLKKRKHYTLCTKQVYMSVCSCSSLIQGAVVVDLPIVSLY